MKGLSSFCAICIKDKPADELVARPLGRNDAIVNICTGCDDEPARAVYGPELGYRIPDPVKIGAQKTAFALAANRIAGKSTGLRGRSESLTKVTQGWVIVRVPRRDDAGRPLDSAEALSTLRERPWFASLRVLGTDVRYHLFERPGKAEAASREVEDTAATVAGLHLLGDTP